MFGKKNIFGFRSRKWKKFKVLADSIKLVNQRNYTVSWDTTFKGFNFDAVVEITRPSFHYSIVVKCIESKEPLKVEQVENFIHDAHDVNATIAILASEYGFEENCSELCKYSFLKLLTLESINQTHPNELTRIFDLLLNIYAFRFSMPNGRFLGLPEEPGILKFWMQNYEIKTAKDSTTPEVLINQFTDTIYSEANGEIKVFKYDFPQETFFIHPNTGHKTQIINLIFNYQLITGVEIEKSEIYKKSPFAIDSIIEEELLKRNNDVDLSKIEAGFDTEFQVKKHYFNPKFLFSYYCEDIKKGFATIVLTESQQGNNLLQARFIISNELAHQFIEITNKEEIKRLTELYETFCVFDRNLTGRFMAFLKTLEETECIDDIKLTPEQERANKADYFFKNREIICELKTLESDTLYKANEILKRYQRRPEFPLAIFGSVGLQQILEKFPDKQKINTEITDVVTDSIERNIEKANRQIRTTKETFSLPDAKGMLIILNDLVFSLDPEIVLYRINKTLNKKTDAKEPRYPFVSCVLLIHTAHIAKLNSELQVMPIIPISNPFSQNKIVEDFIDELLPKWSKFEGVQLLNTANTNLSDFNFKPFRDKRAKKKKKNK